MIHRCISRRTASSGSVTAFPLSHEWLRHLISGCLLAALPLLASEAIGQTEASPGQLQRWLKRFPQADADGDGTLTLKEANQFRQKMLRGTNQATDRKQPRQGQRAGAPRVFPVDPGWNLDRFPEDAVCYQSPEQIKAIFQTVIGENKPAVVSYPKPTDGGLRVVGTGHSFMAPGYRTLPLICKAAGFEQPLYTHTGGGMTGSARYKWEQENGIFQFAGRPVPKLLCSISNAKWDAMMWGPYFNDREEYYSCWVDFCLKYNPDMKFFLSDAWPQLYQLETIPKSEDFFTAEVFEKMGADRRKEYEEHVGGLLEKYPGKIFIMPTCDAMVLAAKAYLRGELPGVEGLHKAIGKKDRSLWVDQLGHIGPGFDRLEGYVFYASLYGKSPELITDEIPFAGKGTFPSDELDSAFRKIAWQAVIGNPMSGVRDADHDGIGDPAN